MTEIAKLLFLKSLDLKEEAISTSNSLKLRFKSYAKISGSKWSWLVSRLVINYNEIEASGILSAHHGETKKPIPISIQIPESNDSKKFKHLLSVTEQVLLEVHDKRLGELKTEIIETFLPAEALTRRSAKEIISSLDYLSERMATNRILPQKTFYEISDFNEDIETLKFTLKVLAKHNALIEKKKLEYYTESGFKLSISNQGELEYRSLKYITAAILFTRDLGLEMKLSGESLNLISTMNSSTGEIKVGLLNLFAGCMLSYGSDLKASELLEILSDNEAQNFDLSGDSLKWKSFTVSSVELKMLRSVALPSISISDLKTTITGIASL